MAREWKPGDVAMVNNVCDPNEPHAIAMCVLPGVTGEAHFVLPSGVKVWGSTSEARPLVVIDPEDREAVQHLANLFGTQPDCLANYGFDAMQAALREFANPAPPKPEEPTGLGAVVVDSNDVTWVLAGRDLPTTTPDNWRAFDGPCVGDWQPYSRIDARRVLSEGVTS
jgi:hypothetical protein